MKADGTARIQLTSGFDYPPAWSPDGTKIAFKRADTSVEPPTEGIWTVDANGSNVTPVVTESGYVAALDRPDWQPLPVNTPSTYARPKGATPIFAPLVPAYDKCTSPNRQHAPSLSFGSCAPPNHLSPTLTVGVGDGSPAFSRSVGSVRVKALLGIPGGPDDTDMAITLSITNVMRKADLSDYTGELGVDLSLQLTDSEGPVAQTTGTFDISATAPCTATASTIDGATCSIDTTAEALIPNAITEGARSIFELGPIRVATAGRTRTPTPWPATAPWRRWECSSPDQRAPLRPRYTGSRDR